MINFHFIVRPVYADILIEQLYVIRSSSLIYRRRVWILLGTMHFVIYFYNIIHIYHKFYISTKKWLTLEFCSFLRRTLTVILCSSVCDARLSQYLNKTVLLIGPAIPETWEEVHILAPSISADADLSSLAAALQKSRVAVSLTSATNMSGVCLSIRTKLCC